MFIYMYRQTVLDISISRNNNALETSIFRKPILSSAYTYFLPTEYKTGLLFVFINVWINYSLNEYGILLLRRRKK